MIDLEICAGSWQSAVAAARGGAQRVELCSALADGGLTPSIGLIRKVLTLRPALRVHVLIRPRPGDFVYTPDEVELMADDIRTAVQAGVDGVVIGALTPDGQIDTEACRHLVQAAQGVANITFHRAFDLCADASEALEQVIQLGCNRLLTSGLAQTALEGVPCLQQLVQQAGGRIALMPAAGVSAANAARIVQATGVHNIHASARGWVQSAMVYRREGVNMGAPGQDEYLRKETDAAEVQAIRQQLNALE